MARPMPTQERLQELFAYDPDTGSLTWRLRISDRFAIKGYSAQRAANCWNARYANKVAFITPDSGGYLTGTIDNIRFRAHRIIFKMFHGIEPEQVDHINGVSTDNRIENLRASSGAENTKNRKMNSKNTSGVCGVFWENRRNKWLAYIKINGRSRHIGYFFTVAEAALARQAMEKELGFSERHGK